VPKTGGPRHIAREPSGFNDSQAMRTNSGRSLPLRPAQAAAGRGAYRLAASGESDGGEAGRSGSAPEPAGREDLPFRVELWNDARTAVEQVLAVTANGTIGYAAYYAATRELPHRYITLRHRNRVVSRWNAPGH
jgi:hypothetical protein